MPVCCSEPCVLCAAPSPLQACQSQPTGRYEWHCSLGWCCLCCRIPFRPRTPQCTTRSWVRRSICCVSGWVCCNGCSSTYNKAHLTDILNKIAANLPLIYPREMGAYLLYVQSSEVTFVSFIVR